jgi:site-specific recombinase XerD
LPSSDILEEIDRFVEWASGRYSKNTVDTYRTIITQYLAYYGQVPSDEDVENAKQGELRTVMDFLNQYSQDSQSKGVASYAIRAYYSFRGASDLVVMLPKYRPSRGISSNIFSSYYYLWKAINGMGIVESAVLSISYALALRLGEVSLLKKKDVVNNGNAIIVHREKGSGGQTIDYLLPLSPCATEVLNRYLSWRYNNIENDYEDHLFVKPSGNPITRRDILRYFKSLRVILGEGERFHQLRHTRATELAERFGDAIAIARFLGHRNINSVMTYIHMAEARKIGKKVNYFHCDQDVSLKEWKWIPV